jgi:flagellar biosynthesis/type III secretory pathway chaperone
METLETLLDLAAAALIKGDFDALTNLTPQIEAQKLARTDRRTAEALQTKALRNARLLDAASRGVKAAQLRISEVTRAPTLTTYDARGQKAQISTFAETRSHRV